MTKKMGVNAALNLFKTALSIIFPLITYPYISRILGVENLGKINYTASIVGYFSLIAALGISTYAIREGGRIRSNSEKLSHLGNQIFTINILSTLVSYLLLLLVVWLFIPNREYQILICIQSLTIVFTTLGVDWINVLFEDFLYITIRSIVIQILSLILMFVLVKTASDLYLYTFISVIGSGISCILNLIYCRKYLKLSLVCRLDLVKHFKPIMVLFSGGLVISIYANSDMLILEWFKGAYYVGLYAVAARVYTILKNLLASIYSVTIPRLSHLFGEQKIDEFKKSYTQILSVVTLILIPMSAGLIVLSREIILFLGGIKFIDATLTLQLLAISLIGAIFGGILTYGLNIPIGRESVNLTGALYGIIVNIGISLLLIPVFKQNGAAAATIASEFFIVLYNFLVVRESGKYIDFVIWRKNLIQALLGFFSIIIIGFGVKLFVTNSLLLIFSITLVGIIVYLLELKLLKNPLLDHILDMVKHKFRRG